MQPAGLLKIIAAIGALASALGAQANPPREPIARIGDQAIYDDDLLQSIAGQLWQLKNQEYELKIKALGNMVNQRLLEAAAISYQELEEIGFRPIIVGGLAVAYWAAGVETNSDIDVVTAAAEEDLHDRLLGLGMKRVGRVWATLDRRVSFERPGSALELRGRRLAPGPTKCVKRSALRRGRSRVTLTRLVCCARRGRLRGSSVPRTTRSRAPLSGRADLPRGGAPAAAGRSAPRARRRPPSAPRRACA